MNVESFLGINVSQFLLAFFRASGMVATAPVFQNRTLPVQARVFIAGALALLSGSYVKTPDLTQYYYWMALALLIQEILVGLIMGFMVNMTMYAVQLAGYLFDVPIGFGIVNVIDPISGVQLPLLGQFNFILANLIFLLINGHHTLILSLVNSFQIIQPGMFFLKKEAVGVVVRAFSAMFYFGFKISIPIMGAIFLSDVALGIISRLIPQINVFIIGFPVKIMLGLFVLILFIPIYIFLIERSFSDSGDTFRMLRLMLRNLSNTG